MRLSDIKGERTLDVIAEIIEPIANIAEDEAVSGLFKREKLPEGVSVKSFLLKRVRQHLPALLKNHKSDIISVLSAVEGVEPREYEGALNLVKLVKDCTELLTDEAFEVLFISAQTGGTSGSAPVNTEDLKA